MVNAVHGSLFQASRSERCRTEPTGHRLARAGEGQAFEGSVAAARQRPHAWPRRRPARIPFAGKIETDGPQKHPLADLESRLISAQVERTVLEARIKAAEEEVELEAKKDEAVAPAKQEGELISQQEAALRDAMVDKIIEDSAEVQKQKALVAGKQSRLKEIEEKSAKGKAGPRIRSNWPKKSATTSRRLTKLRSEMKPRVRSEAELSIIARRTEMGTAQVAKRMEELAKMRSDREACRVMEQMLQERYEEQRKNVEQSSGDTHGVGFQARRAGPGGEGVRVDRRSGRCSCRPSEAPPRGSR